MTTGAASLPAAGSGVPTGVLARVIRFVEREGLAITAVALYATALLLVIPGELVQDSWATLVAGREIAGSGLPHHETLTVMAHGVRWVDQQWLAQLTFYELFRAGGMPLILFTHATLIASSFALAVATARRRGARPTAVFAVALLCFFVAPWGWQLRAQSFGPILFVAVLSLLVLNGRDRPRRALLTLPLLVVWANLHGSVVLGAFLVALFGAVLLTERRDPATAVLLVVCAPLTVLCSPYAASLPGYYRQLLVDPPFRGLLVEWTAPRPAAITALFYVLAFATVWALGRWGRHSTVFERLVLVVTLGAALTATRNIVWFGLAALMLLPVLVDRARWVDGGGRPLVRAALAACACAGLTIAIVATAARPAQWFQSGWPAPAASAVAAVAHEDASTRVFASDRLADWLLWREPALRGHVAFDIRFELNTAAQVKALHRFFGRVGPRWQAPARGYDVIVLDRAENDSVRKALERTGAFTRTYLDHDVAVLERG